MAVEQTAVAQLDEEVTKEGAVKQVQVAQMWLVAREAAGGLKLI